MHRIAALALCAALLTPAAVSAQAGASLGAPYPTAPAVETAVVPPAPAEEAPAEVAVDAAPAADAVDEPGAASALSSEAAPRWASQPARGIDPEILALRGEQAGRDPAEPRRYQTFSVSTRRWEPAQADAAGDEGPDFGASLGHAAAGFGIGATGGALLVGGIAAAATCGTDGGWCFLFGLTFGGLGAAGLGPVGAALGAWGFGEKSGGTGNFFAALGGAYLGAGAGVGIAALLGSAGEGGWAAILGPVGGIVLSMLGAAAGYQLSSGPRRDAGTQAAAPSILPTLAPTADGQGATVGAAGTF